MAEAVISVVLKLLGSLALDDVIKEVSQLKSVEGNVENLKRNLRSIQAVLQDAEIKRWTSNSSQSLRVWLETLEDDSHEMGNVLDKWNTLILRSKIVREERKRKQVCFFKPFSRLHFLKVNELIPRREIARKIKELDDKVTKTAQEISGLGLMANIMRGIDHKQVVEGRSETTSIVDETEIQGRGKDEKALLDMLMCESSQGGQLEAISIVGMGGLGKTTLAQLAFNNANVKNHFVKRVWVGVSDPFDLPNIASAIIENHRDDFRDTRRQPEKFLTLEAAFKCISERLGGSRFLLVLDDVWNDEYSKWQPLETILGKLDAVGSKVLVTTRSEKVATVMGAKPSTTISLAKLTDEECQLIFERHAFKNKNEEEIQQLKDIGVQIVKKCQGLPLAAKTLGGLMRFKRTEKEWEDALRSQLWEQNVPEVEKHLFGPFLLSYLDLPSLEKRCLLFCSVFPKDNLICRMQLIELWVSEGFMDSEDKGASVFQNLATRCFFQDLKERSCYDGTDVRCKMHDILHDFVRYLTKGECELKEISNINLNENTMRSKVGRRSRHLTIALESGAQFPNLELTRDNEEYLHSFQVLGHGGNSTLSSSMFSSLRHLRALKLNGCEIESLPEDFGNLFIHLRFLDFASVHLVKLPDSICNLCNLQTLRLGGSLVELPKGIEKLVNLRHLFILGCRSLKGLPKEIGRLSSLQTLDQYSIPKDEKKYLNLREVTKMNNLKIQYLHIDPNMLEDAADGANKIELNKLGHVNSLFLNYEYRDGSERDAAIEFLELHPKLKFLQVRRYSCHTLSPGWNMMLNCLREIQFQFSHALRTLPSNFGKLPSLESLHFYALSSLIRVGPEFLGIADQGDEDIPSTTTLFPKLKVLFFSGMPCWKEWEGNLPAAIPSLRIMPCLHTLEFRNCCNLQVLPEFLQTVQLQILSIKGGCFLVENCKTRSGEEWEKISHVQNILIDDVHVQKNGHVVDTDG